jgi:hypothetical protein
MWEIYDELIAAVPPDLQVRECLVGMHWTLIRSRAVGMALTPFGAPRNYGPKGASVASGIGEQIAGMRVCELAQFVKSWDPYEPAWDLLPSIRFKFPGAGGKKCLAAAVHAGPGQRVCPLL